jgi:hypothetical protein
MAVFINPMAILRLNTNSDGMLHSGGGCRALKFLQHRLLCYASAVVVTPRTAALGFHNRRLN